MRHIGKGITATLLATVIACSDSTGPAAERNDSGTGTLTLLVTADIDGQEVPGGFVTDFYVSVRDAEGNAVSGAAVRITNETLGEMTLLEAEQGSGEYRAERNSFPQGDFRLDVTRETDLVEGVIVGGPGIHSITAPLLTDTLTAGQALTVLWDVPSQARGAEIETRDYQSSVVPDNGQAIVPAESNLARAEQRIRVRRYNEVDIVGGLPGSRLEVSIRREIEPIMVRSPEAN